MAEVFIGSSVGAEGFSRRVAIKRVLPGFSDNPAFAQMFVGEAQICSRMVHPNIVSVLDFDRDADSRLFLVMELVDGKDLDALVSTGLLPFPVVIFAISEVLRGLGYAHDLPVGADLRGVVHRDVSPHNVLLSWEGAVKVSDFGIAKARAASEATASVFIKGKPAYMSPEQANGQALDGRSDLFAVGIMMWEMLVGRRLFVGEDTRATLAAVLFGQIPRPRSLRGDIPKDLDRVTMKLLERELPSRYATAEAAIADLLDCADAPKGGRDVLVRILAERFPSEVRVRQSQLRHGSMPPVPIHAAPTIAVAGTPPPVPSLGAAMAAPTMTMAPPRRLGTAARVALIGGITAVTAGVAFAVVASLTSRGSKPAATAPPIDAAAEARAVDAPIDMPPPPPDAPIDAPVDAPVDAPKKDASSGQDRHPVPEKRTGVLHVQADPQLTVIVDGIRKDTPTDITLPIGKHVVRLKNEDYNHDESVPVTITESHTTTIDRVGWKH